MVATKNALDENQMVKQLSGRLGDLSEDDKSTILDGAITFRSLCANCHGADGKGLAQVAALWPLRHLWEPAHCNSQKNIRQSGF